MSSIKTGASGAGGLATSYKSTAFTAAAGFNYLANTTAAGFTSTLPAGSVGAVIQFSDDAGKWATNPLIIAPSTGQVIQGLAANDTLTCNISGAFVQLAWDSTNSWWVVTGSGFQTVANYSPGVNAGLVPSTGVPGIVSGGTPATGTIGESFNDYQAVLSTTQGVDRLTFARVLQPGTWLIHCNTSIQPNGGSTGNAICKIITGGTNTSGTITGGANTGSNGQDYSMINGTLASGNTYPMGGMTKVVYISVATTYNFTVQAATVASGFYGIMAASYVRIG